MQLHIAKRKTSKTYTKFALSAVLIMFLSVAALNEVEKKASFLLKSATPLKAFSDFRNDCLFRNEAIFSSSCRLVYKMEGFNLRQSIKY